ncbi:MAG TPA: DUF2752 domain-containing protein [Terrimicrobiaceae bacterium]
MKSLRHKENRTSYPGTELPNAALGYDQRKTRAILAIVIVALLVIAAVVPLASPSGIFVLRICAFQGATGLPCPLCGGSRAAQALLRGDLARALDLNVAAIPALVFLLAATIVLGFEAASGRALIDWDALLVRTRSLLPLLATLLFFYWIVHLAGAIRSMKTELVNLENPIARAVCQRFSMQKQ